MRETQNTLHYLSLLDTRVTKNKGGLYGMLNSKKGVRAYFGS